MGNKPEPFLGTTTDREKAFGHFKSIELTVSQDPYQQYSQHDRQRTRRYTKETLQRYERCVNPKCQQGGLDLQQFVELWPDGEHTIACNGHEGTPAGRKVGDSCTNVFKVTLQTRR